MCCGPCGSHTLCKVQCRRITCQRNIPHSASMQSMLVSGKTFNCKVKDMPCQISNVDGSGFVKDPKPQVALATKESKCVSQVEQLGKELL